MAETSRPPWMMAAPLAFVLILALAWSGYWYVTLGRAKAGFSQFERDLAARGGALSCNEERWGGYPFRISLACQRLAIRLTPSGATFETANVEALAQAYALRHVIAIAQGPSRLSFEGEAFDLEHAPMTASFHLHADGNAEAALVVEDTRLRAAGAVVAEGRRLELHGRNRGPQAVEFAVMGEATRVALAHGAEIDVPKLEMRGLIDNLPPGFAALPGDLLIAAGTTGGRIELQSLDAVVDGSVVKGSGAVVLGADGYPDGRIAMRLSELGRLLSSLEKKGLFDRQAAAAGSMLLGLLLGDKGEAPLDLTFRAGSIYWGPFKLLEHGPIR